MKSQARLLIIVPLLATCGLATEVAQKRVPELAAVPTPVPDRHVALEGQHNFRDLGGYQTVDGRTVKWGEVYRSGELAALTDEDVDQLAELGLRTVVNFLLPDEIEKKGPDRLPDGTHEVPRPISGDRAAQQTMMVTAAIKAAEFDKVPPEINPEFHRLLIDEGNGVQSVGGSRIRSTNSFSKRWTSMSVCTVHVLPSANQGSMRSEVQTVLP
jgi:hypothetical protein